MGSEIYPKDFFEQRRKIDSRLCFILMPLKKEYEEIRKAISKIVCDCDFEPVRADDIRQPGIIHSDIWDHIQRAAVIIADVTEHNPNVFFELGVAATVKDKSRVIIIRQPTGTGEYPFDIRPFRCLHYENTFGGADKLAENLKSYLGTIRREDDALWDILYKMQEWEEYDHDYDFLLEPLDLKRLKKLPWVNTLDKDVAAYVFASSMYRHVDCKFWADLNKDNMNVADHTARLICGRYERPGLRAAYALQYMEADVKNESLRNLKHMEQRRWPDDVLERLIQSIHSQRVKEFVKVEAGAHITSENAQKLLDSFEQWDVF